MRWLLHGTLTAAVADALRRHGHETLGMKELDTAPSAGAGDILKAAQTKQLDLITNSNEVVDRIYDERIPFNRAVVYLQLSGEGVEQDDAVDRLFERYKRLTPGRLYTVTATRVKVRQLPGAA